MSGNKSLRKGKKGEYLSRKKLEELGYEVVNQAEDPAKADIRVVSKKHWNGIDKWKVGEDWEVKYGSHVPKCIYDWLAEKGADCLMVKRIGPKDRGRPWLLIRELK